jgi:hypothetical protein
VKRHIAGEVAHNIFAAAAAALLPLFVAALLFAGGSNRVNPLVQFIVAPGNIIAFWWRGDNYDEHSFAMASFIFSALSEASFGALAGASVGAFQRGCPNRFRLRSIFWLTTLSAVALATHGWWWVYVSTLVGDCIWLWLFLAAIVVLALRLQQIVTTRRAA